MPRPNYQTDICHLESRTGIATVLKTVVLMGRGGSNPSDGVLVVLGLFAFIPRVSGGESCGIKVRVLYVSLSMM